MEEATEQGYSSLGPVPGRARWPEVLQLLPPAPRGQGSPTSLRSQHIPVSVSSHLPLNSAPVCALWPAHLPSGAPWVLNSCSVFLNPGLGGCGLR